MRSARRFIARGQFDEAEALIRHALVQEPNLPATHVALAKLRWPGMDYLEWLGWFHTVLSPDLYVEIGVEKGNSLGQVRPDTQVVGIDPSPQAQPQARCAGPVQLFRQTSAEFFTAVPPECHLQTRGFDLAFIDGDHRFEEVLADFIALEQWAAPEAVVLMHDTIPLTSATSTSQRQTGFLQRRCLENCSLPAQPAARPAPGDTARRTYRSDRCDGAQRCVTHFAGALARDTGRVRGIAKRTCSQYASRLLGTRKERQGLDVEMAQSGARAMTHAKSWASRPARYSSSSAAITHCL